MFEVLPKKAVAYHEYGRQWFIPILRPHLELSREDRDWPIFLTKGQGYARSSKVGRTASLSVEVSFFSSEGLMVISYAGEPVEHETRCTDNKAKI